MNLKEDYKLFQNEINKRDIKYLIHFTPTINLFSILENKKILSRAKIENLDIEQFDILDYINFPDKTRYDDKSYINLTISSPNTLLLDKFVEQSKDDITIKWCILKINTKYIYEKDTLFSVVNAASYVAKNQFGIYGDYKQFQKLFQDEVKYNNRTFSRNYYKLQDKFTTDIQAEVLVKNEINIDDIIEVCFLNDNDLAESKAAMSQFDTSKFIVDKDIFNPNRSKN